MTSDKIKVESGLQLLARLAKKVDIANFYPILFENGPQTGQVIELYSNQSTHNLLEDIIAESLIPKQFGGVQASVLVFNTDGDLCVNSLRYSLRRKIHNRIQSENFLKYGNHHIENKILDSLKNLFTIQLYDVTQFYTTVQNLENVLCKHPNLSMLVFNSLTAFYWSEQGYKITKMDIYKKTLLSLIQKVTKDHKVTILYTRPEYFSSTKESIENLEPCCKLATDEFINYRIQVVYCYNNKHYVNVQMYDKINKLEFQIINNSIEWIV